MPDRRKDSGQGPSFLKGFLITLSIFFTSALLVLVPLIGLPMALVLVPYFAAAIGTRYAHPKERVPLALTCSLLWSALETVVLLTIMGIPAGAAPMGLKVGGIEVVIILFLWVPPAIFSMWGALHPWRDPYSRSRA